MAISPTPTGGYHDAVFADRCPFHRFVKLELVEDREIQDALGLEAIGGYWYCPFWECDFIKVAPAILGALTSKDKLFFLLVIRSKVLLKKIIRYFTNGGK